MPTKLEECARARILLADLNCVWRYAAAACDYPLAQIISEAMEFIRPSATPQLSFLSILDEAGKE